MSPLIVDYYQGRKRNIFQRGKVIFVGFFFFFSSSFFFPFSSVKRFFLVENSHFGRPKTNFTGFEKWKERKEKKVPLCIWLFPLPFQVHFSTFPFSIFLLFFSLFPFFLASLFQVRQQKFPDEKCRGELPIPPPVTSLTAPGGTSGWISSS